MDSDAETLTFQLGVTDLQALAEEKGHRYVLSSDGRREFVIRDDGTVLIQADRVLPHMRGEKRKMPTVWMRSIRFHTYMGKPQDEGEIYLAHEDQVDNLITLRFAVRDTPPKKATR